jgi:hypothetical protein
MKWIFALIAIAFATATIVTASDARPKDRTDHCTVNGKKVPCP